MSTATNAGAQGQSSSSGAASSSVSTKPVHPVTLSSFAPTGCELSTWAYITSTRPIENSCSDSLKEESKSPLISPILLPNLVTAHANSLKIYSVDPSSGTLLIASSYENLAGTIISLNVIPCSTGNSSGKMRDALLLGFAGHPRMSIVYPSSDLDSCEGTENENNNGWSGVLTASSILDLTPALIERSKGSVAPLEQDLSCTVTNQNGKTPTVTVILGGGIAVATFQLTRTNFKNSTSSWWRVASEPYILPLPHLSASLQSSQKPNAAAGAAQTGKYAKNTSNNLASGRVSHGFGDVISSAFLTGYKEPVVTLLHSNPFRHGGRTCPGRLAHHSSSTRNPLTLTAVSVSIDQKRSVVLWSLRDAIPSDAFELYQHPRGGVLVVCVNEILYVDCAGKILCCTAMNGWVRSTASFNLRPKSGMNTGLMQPNPSPLKKLSLQLDGCRLAFVNENVALVSLRNGSLYSLELHEKKEISFVNDNPERMCISLCPVGKKLGGLGMISTLSAFSLPVNTSFENFLDEDSNLKNTKKEELDESKFADEVKNEDDVTQRQSLSLGLVFAGSRMGDSTIIMYGLKEKVGLIPLGKDEEKEKAVAAAVEAVERVKRKRDEPAEEEHSDAVMDKNNSKKVKINSEDRDVEINTNLNSKNDVTVAVSDDEENVSEEEMLRREEEELYAPTRDDKNNTSVLQFSGSNDEHSGKLDETLLPGLYAKQLYRPQIRNLSMFRHIKVLDSLTGLGPMGSGCEGPVACNLPSATKTAINSGSTMSINSCGYGSSGGLAILTSPGLNYGSTIISEADCKGLGSIYNCPNSGYVFLNKKEVNSGCMILKLVQRSSEEKALVEVQLGTLLSDALDQMEMENVVPTFYSIKDILTGMTILSVNEFSADYDSSDDSVSNIAIMAQYDDSYAIIVLSAQDGKLSLVHTHMIGACDESVTLERGNIVSIAKSEELNKRKSKDRSQGLSIGCVWSSGHASIFSICLQKDLMWEVREIILEGCHEENNIEDSMQDQSHKITAIDMFSVADNIFESETINENSSNSEDESPKQDTKTEGLNYIFDEDDAELYGQDFIDSGNDLKPSASLSHEELPHSQIPPSRYNTLGGYISGANLSDSNTSIIAVCRESSQLQLFDVTKLFSNSSSLVQQLSREEASQALVWDCTDGCGYGVAHLASGSKKKGPTFDNIFVSEIRFFFCGPSDTTQQSGTQQKDLSILRSLCLLVATNVGDLHLYTGSKLRNRNNIDVGFKRVPLRTVTRTSREEQRHRSKLRRKDIVCDDDADMVFQPSKLHRFFSLSGQDGLFSATARPLWFVSERGAPSALSHRLRHCAPAGGSSLPVSGFCSGLSVNSKKDSSNVGFITVHERIGRVGSQRITFFSGCVLLNFGMMFSSGLY
jgi:hypothetical protein